MPSVMSHKNVPKVVWYIFVQLSSLNNTMSMVSGVSVQVSGGSRGRGRYFILLILLVLVLVLGCRQIMPLTPDTRHLTPKIKPCFANYIRDTMLVCIFHHRVHSRAPQYLQYLASMSCPSALHSGQAWVEIFRLNACANSTVTIPVGTAIKP